MNDFTKDELGAIALALCDLGIINPEKGTLYRKVKSMIDNYCEHKTDVFPLYTATGDIPVGGLCYSCEELVDNYE